MTTSKPTLLQLAKQGNEKAIAALLNYQLHPKGIVAHVSLNNRCLQILLQSVRPLEQQPLLNFLQRAIQKLDIATVQNVRVCGQRMSDEFPAWIEEFQVTSAAKPDANNPNAELAQCMTTPVPRQKPLSSESGSSESGSSQPVRPQPQPASKPACPRTYLVPSILVTLFAFLPIGVVALYFASQVEPKYYRQDYEGARAASNLAKKLCIAGGCLAVATYLLVFWSIGISATNQRKNRDVEMRAKTELEMINMQQRSFFMRTNRFATSLNSLSFAPPQSEHYKYAIVEADETKSIITATARKPGLRSFTGVVYGVKSMKRFASPQKQMEQMSWFEASEVCATSEPSMIPPTPQVTEHEIICPP
jgi:hypothetical protein